jgi:outer membrane protein
MSKSPYALRRALAVALMSAAVSCATAASAQTTKPAAPQAATQAPASLPIAVMRMQRILRESAAGKSAAQQVGELQAKYQAEIARRQEKIRAEQDDLARQQAVLSPDAFEEKRRAYQRDATDLQQLLQDRNGELDLIEKKVYAEIQASLLTILKQYQPERGIKVLLEAQNTVSYDPTLDITEEIIQRLDKVLPTIKISEGNRGAAASKKASPAE